MPDDKSKTAVNVGSIHENNLSMVDFGNSCLKLGVRVEGEPKRWMELDHDDWKILQMLLNKPVLSDGTCAADHSKSLKNLSLYAEAAAKWMKENPGT